MKLAEALILRANNQNRLAELKERVLRNAKVQEGDEPAEDPQALLAEVERGAKQLVRLIQNINFTNATTELESGVTIADAIAVRDVLKLRHGLYKQLAADASITQSRFSRSEVKFQSTVNVAEIQNIADELAKEYRLLDAKLQGANWQVDLKEK